MSVSLSVPGGWLVEPQADYNFKAKREEKYDGGKTLEKC